MPRVYVHYYVDATFGFTSIHFSGSDARANVFIKDKTIFGLCLLGIKQIPSALTLWDDKSKSWKVSNSAWVTLLPYYSNAPEIYGLMPYAIKAQWQTFITGKAAASKVDGSGFNVPLNDAEAAQGFFNAQAFNHAVTQTASQVSDRETLVSLLGLNNWGQFDGLSKAELKKIYRSAALKLHPDRNNGDGSQMSKLNELFAIYGSK
jgi:hypothetical protein